MSDDFPIGGPRQAVYDALSGRRFAMSRFSDKHWKRVDGLEAHVYGAGSKLSLRFGGEQVADGPMADVLAFIDRDEWKPK